MTLISFLWIIEQLGTFPLKQFPFSGILGPVMPNYMLYSVFRFITSIGCSGYIIVSFVYLAESMDNRGRGYLGVFLIMAWSSGGSAVAFFGKFFRNFLVYDWASAIVFATLGFIITGKKGAITSICSKKTSVIICKIWKKSSIAPKFFSIFQPD